MKFFWKLYFSIIIITIICFSIGGYMLIQTNFQTNLQREIESVYLENDILSSTLLRDFMVLEKNSTDAIDTRNALQDFIANITIETFDGSISFCIRDQEGNLIYQNGGFDNTITYKTKKGQRGYIIEEKKESYTLHSMKMISLYGQNVYVENMRNISDIFVSRANQFYSLFYYTIILSIISGIIIYIITRWLVKPIEQLSNATKRITDGNNIEALPVKSHDEIGQLTKNFNTMSLRLTKSMNELQQALERQEIFVSNFAHELKTPLTSMIGYGDMLRSKRLSEQDIIGYANIIVEQGKRLETMSMKLLDLIVLKKQDFKMYPIFTKDFFQDIIAVVNPIMKEANISFTTNIENTKIYIEPDLMKTVIFNLLDNARKAIETRGSISIQGKQLENCYEIRIQDNGCGMEEQELDKIKEAFYMIDKSRTRRVGGAGLGLAICEQIVTLHHASIHFHSIKGTGTEVIVLLKETNTYE